MNASLSTAAPWWRPSPGHRLIVRGDRPLVGTYPISGAKNAALPLMVSALLTPHLVTLRNVPANLDVAVLAALLQRLGCGMHWSTADSGLTVTIAADRVQPQHIDAELVTRMRASRADRLRRPLSRGRTAALWAECRPGQVAGRRHDPRR
jgi:UDP-N-acetylglucosamine 1-carboxyvinyltransferase